LLIIPALICAASCDKNPQANLIASGTTGSLTWALCSNGTLTISGNGEMPNYERILDDDSRVSSSPWSLYRENITNVIIEDGVIGIGDWAFFGCYNMMSVNFSNSVTKIGEYAFYSHGLSSVTLGNSVMIIGNGAFLPGSRGLTEIIIYSKKPPKLDFYGNQFGFAASCYTGIKLFVPAGCVEAYHTATVWENFLIIGEIGEPSPVIAAGTQMSFNWDMCFFTWMLYNDGTAIVNGRSMPGYNCMKCALPWYNNYRNMGTPKNPYFTF